MCYVKYFFSFYSKAPVRAIACWFYYLLIKYQLPFEHSVVKSTRSSLQETLENIFDCFQVLSEQNIGLRMLKVYSMEDFRPYVIFCHAEKWINGIVFLAKAKINVL